MKGVFNEPTERLCKECSSPFIAVRTHELYCPEHCGRLNTWKLSRSRSTERLKAQALEVMGRVCINCGNNDHRVLQFHHIHGGGTKERKGNWKNMFYVLKDVIEQDRKKYQLLCANCHAITTYEERQRAV